MGSKRTSKHNRWTPEEDRLLRSAHQMYGGRNWIEIAKMVPNRNHQQCHQRWFRVLAPGLSTGNWTKFEDNALLRAIVDYSSRHNVVDWSIIAHKVGGRSSRQCQDRWECHLDPTINREPFTEEEDESLSQCYKIYGNNWTHIACRMKGRTKEQVKKRVLTIFPGVKCTGPIGRPKKQSLKVPDDDILSLSSKSQESPLELSTPVVLPNPYTESPQPWNEAIEYLTTIQFDSAPNDTNYLLFYGENDAFFHSFTLPLQKSLPAP
ncbi:myb-like DNA-binding protein [Thraustotheca clavata]|uniref:Myb-like DNA-binding protein n=1 Tax=Thraustotheca clavata TaxID=74557 RepID=A0A1V9ZY94_9STRA|nr:myb-like DNA-binding protein [Thraustotheca clavata]